MHLWLSFYVPTHKVIAFRSDWEKALWLTLVLPTTDPHSLPVLTRKGHQEIDSKHLLGAQQTGTSSVQRGWWGWQRIHIHVTASPEGHKNIINATPLKWNFMIWGVWMPSHVQSTLNRKEILFEDVKIKLTCFKIAIGGHCSHFTSHTSKPSSHSSDIYPGSN